LRFDNYLVPGGSAVGRIAHSHPPQQETFEIRSGRLTVRIDGDEWAAPPGTRFAIHRRPATRSETTTTRKMHAVVEIRPSLDSKHFFETMAGLARDGETNR
jgi:hypothetical protein